jgi:hypothetical protein
MSSRFVSGGTNEEPIQRDEEWVKTQQEIDAARREKQERSKQAEGKSLYDALQQNKGTWMRRVTPSPHEETANLPGCIEQPPSKKPSKNQSSLETSSNPSRKTKSTSWIPCANPSAQRRKPSVRKPVNN